MSNKIQRNTPCPCKSGKKHKDCCEVKPEKITPRPAAAGGVEYPSKVKGTIPDFSGVASRVMPTAQKPKVQGAFGKPGRLRHPIRHTTVTNPKFLSRAARQRLQTA